MHPAENSQDESPAKKQRIINNTGFAALRSRWASDLTKASSSDCNSRGHQNPYYC